jgi:hypothetical protein
VKSEIIEVRESTIQASAGRPTSEYMVKLVH